MATRRIAIRSRTISQPTSLLHFVYSRMIHRPLIYTQTHPHTHFYAHTPQLNSFFGFTTNAIAVVVIVLLLMRNVDFFVVRKRRCLACELAGVGYSGIATNTCTYMHTNIWNGLFRKGVSVFCFLGLLIFLFLFAKSLFGHEVVRRNPSVVAMTQLSMKPAANQLLLRH